MSSRITLIYSMNEKKEANYIINALNREGIDVQDSHYKNSYSYFSDIDAVYDLKPGGYVVVLLSDSFYESDWTSYELNYYVNNGINNRNITFVPVYLKNTRKIFKDKSVVSFNLYNDFNKGVEKLVNYLKYIKHIDFESLSSEKFEHMVYQILKAMRINVLDSESNVDNGFDFIAESRHKDPFGGEMNIKWIVECKYYENRSPDLKTLHQLLNSVENNSRVDRGVLFTNGILTSTAVEFLNSRNRKNVISVVDGTQLKKLLLKYPNVIKNVFGERV